jgi:hypothetical protein
MRQAQTGSVEPLQPGERAVSVSASYTLPTFIVVGAMRSGTTALAHHLAGHPQIYIAPTKEIHFFDDNFERGLPWYETHFAGARGKAAIGEATPNYMYDRSAIARIRATLPDAKLIAILRNPVDRAYSHYWQKRSYGTEPLTFEQAIEREGERISEGGRARRLYSYVDRGRYLGQLRGICDVFPRESLHVMLFEEMKRDARAALEATWAFLGVDEALMSDAPVRPANRYVTFRSPRVRQLSKSLPKPLKTLVGKLNSRRDDYPPLDPALRARLTRFFEDENAGLESWLGRDLSIWRA